jgi:hypothetical protein
MEFDIKVQNLANWVVTSTKEVGVGCLWYTLGTEKLLELEKLSTDVCKQ